MNIGTQSRIGIIGGAGPMAGALLFEKIIVVCQKYGCKIDADFPYCLLINYPFLPMLTGGFDKCRLMKQLEECFDSFVTHKTHIAAIACNTLHAFLPSLPQEIKLVHMINETKKYIENRGWKTPLVLCSTTAAKNKLHAQYFPCKYPRDDLQKFIDHLIDEITRGCCLKEASMQLNLLCKDQGPVILGCTELTLLHERFPLTFEKICAPDSLVAEKIGEMIFTKQ